LKVIEGYELARQALSRRSPLISHPVSPRVRDALKKLFNTDSPEVAVQKIVQDVRDRGDAAVRELTLKIDNIPLDRLEVERKQVGAAYKSETTRTPHSRPAATAVRRLASAATEQTVAMRPPCRAVSITYFRTPSIAL
jgi:histidinol dehydrogenase